MIIAAAAGAAAGSNLIRNKQINQDTRSVLSTQTNINSLRFKESNC